MLIKLHKAVFPTASEKSSSDIEDKYWVYCIEKAEIIFFFFPQVHCLQHYCLWQTSKCFPERVKFALCKMGSLDELWNWVIFYIAVNRQAMKTIYTWSSECDLSENRQSTQKHKQAATVHYYNGNGNACMWNAVWFVEWFTWSNCTYVILLDFLWHNCVKLKNAAFCFANCKQFFNR